MFLTEEKLIVEHILPASSIRVNAIDNLWICELLTAISISVYVKQLNLYVSNYIGDF